MIDASKQANEDLCSRLRSWKFETAYRYATELEIDKDDLELIKALSDTFGDCGRVDGAMGLIVGAAVSSLLPCTWNNMKMRTNHSNIYYK